MCSPDVVGGVVAHLTLNTSGTNEVRNFGEGGFDVSTATDDFHAGNLRAGGLGRSRRCDSVLQAVVHTVQQKAEMGKEVSPDEGL
jgi:hypothetical protein